MKKIIFLDEYTLGETDLTPLHKLGNYTGYNNTPREDIVSRCADAEIVITNKILLRRETLIQLPKLRLICIAATGMNNVDLEAAAELGITVKNAVGYSTHAVCETTIGAALALNRQIIYYDRYTKEKYPDAPLQFHYGRTTRQLHGSTWGIIGLGNIGREVAQVASALGCEVRYTSTSGTERKESYASMSLDKLLSWADIVSIHCPLTENTRNLISEREFAIMKPSSILINVARGSIVNEQALADALNNGTIAGAALDVFAHEPIHIDNPLLKINDPDRLLLSPHNAWSPREAIKVLVECIEDNIKSYLG